MTIAAISIITSKLTSKLLELTQKTMSSPWSNHYPQRSTRSNSNSFHHPLSHIYNNDDEREQEDEDEKKEYEETKENESNVNNTSHFSLSQQSQSQSRSLSHVSSGWMTVQQFVNETDLTSQREQTKLFLTLLRDIFKELSPQTQICIILLSVGCFLILISLPGPMIIGTLLLCTGLMGIGNVITQKYIKFAKENGLISLLKPGIFKNFILKGSVCTVFVIFLLFVFCSLYHFRMVLHVHLNNTFLICT